jgi:hypothetical protein
MPKSQHQVPEVARRSSCACSFVTRAAMFEAVVTVSPSLEVFQYPPCTGRAVYTRGVPRPTA